MSKKKFTFETFLSGLQTNFLEVFITNHGNTNSIKVDFNDEDLSDEDLKNWSVMVPPGKIHHDTISLKGEIRVNGRIVKRKS